MPPITILSPYSGRPVVVREQDLGRAIRDEEGRVFYVVEDPEHGRYAARTRKGSDKDLERYRAIQAKTAQLDADPAAQASRSAQAHDATGARRRNLQGIVVVLLLLLAAAAGGYVFVAHPQWLGLGGDEAETDTPPAPTDSDDATQRQDLPRRDPPLRTMPVTFNAPIDRGYDPSQPPPDRTDRKPAPSASRQTPTEQHDPNQALPSPGDRSARFDQDPRPVIVPTHTFRSLPSEPVVFVTFDSDAQSSARPDKTKGKTHAEFRHTASGLRYKITHHTDGPPAKAGHYVHVRYTAQTLDGEPLIDDAEQTFVLMSGEAIRAFDEGLAGIREGEQLRLMVPRGHSEAGRLPGIERVPDQPFLMDVQLVSVRPGVTYIVEQPGKVDRETAMPGDTIAIHYVAKVEGKRQVIDSTSLRGEPMRLTLGRGEVIPGLELGLTGMRLGETRLLSVPHYLAYGDNDVAGGLIPPKAVLSFRVMLIDIDRPDRAE